MNKVRVSQCPAERPLTFLDGMREACMLVGFDWIILYMNDAAHRLLSTEGNPLEGQTLQISFPGFDRWEGSGYFRTCMASRVSQDFQGEWLDFHLEPTPEGLFVSILEVVLPKKASYAMPLHPRELSPTSPFNNINVAYSRSEFVLGPDGEPCDMRFLEVSSNFAEYLGKNPADLVGKPHSEIFPAADPFWFTTFSHVARSGVPLRFEKLAEPLRRHVEVFAFSPAPMQVSVFYSDITGRRNNELAVRELNAQLRTKTSMLEEVLADLDAFAYSVSHDLRAPLRHIAGFAELLKAQGVAQLDAKARGHLDTILRSTLVMGHLIDELLSFSHSGQVPMHKDLVDLNPLVQAIIADLAPEIALRTLHWDISPLPRVRADLTLLRSVLTNLLSNAIKYTRPRDEAHIQIGWRDDPENITIFVKDDGVGFNPNHTARLFKVFQRLHGKSQFEGTGIGLANVHRIILRHGGRTWAQGEEGAGATFSFTLPKDASP